MAYINKITENIKSTKIDTTVAEFKKNARIEFVLAASLSFRLFAVLALSENTSAGSEQHAVKPHVKKQHKLLIMDHNKKLCSSEVSSLTDKSGIIELCGCIFIKTSDAIIDIDFYKNLKVLKNDSQITYYKFIFFPKNHFF
jgi:hypothetical protein